MNTIYKSNITSPYQRLSKEALNTQSEGHPVQQEILKSIGTFHITAVVEEDRQTLSTFNKVPGLIAFMCTLKKDDVIIGIGRGTAMISRVNKYIERTVRVAFNASLIDAMVRSTKMLDALYLGTTNIQRDSVTTVNNSFDATDSFIKISDKQKKYLLELVKTKVPDISKRNQWKEQIEDFSKDEASNAIKSFMK